jgi:hypothetical protein
MRFNYGDCVGRDLGAVEHIVEEIRQRGRVWNCNRRAILVLMDGRSCKYSKDLVTIRDGIRQPLQDNGADALPSAVTITIICEWLTLSRRAKE